MNLHRIPEGQQALESRLVQRLASYVERESPTGDAGCLDAIAALIAADFEQLGAAVTTVEAGGITHRTIEVPGFGSKAAQLPVLVLAHHDTVWPVGRLGAAPIRVEDGWFHGPGSYDMKGGIAALWEAVSAASAAGRDRRPLRLLLIADEEIGSPSARALVESQLGRVVAAIGLEPPRPGGGVKTSRWGSTRIRWRVTGREAHAALDPERGISAIDELVDQLLWLRKRLDGAAGVLCNLGTIRGGTRANVVAGSGEVEIGLRFTSAAAEAELLPALLAPIAIRDGALIETEILSNRPCWEPGDASTSLLAIFADAAAALGQGFDSGPATGAADTNVTGALGIPTLDGLGPDGRGAHAPNEAVLIAALSERALLLAEAWPRI